MMHRKLKSDYVNAGGRMRIHISSLPNRSLGYAARSFRNDELLMNVILLLTLLSKRLKIQFYLAQKIGN